MSEDNKELLIVLGALVAIVALIVLGAILTAGGCP